MIIRTPFVLVSCLGALLSGCVDSPDLTNSLAKLTDGIKSGIQTPLTGAPSGHFKDSPLYQAMRDGGHGWPRAAITINSLPQNAYTPSLVTNVGNRFSYGLSYCMNVSVVIWKDPVHSQHFDDVNFCGNDIPSNIVSASSGDFLLWGGSLAPTPNSGARRTNGPNPPKNNFPQGSGYVGSFASTNGMNLFAQFMYAMGYDLAENSDDHRAWIVSMPSASQMPH